MPSSKTLWIAALLLLTAALVATGCSSADSKTQKPAREPAAVSTVQVQQQEVTRTVEAVGTLIAFDQVVVSSQVEGPVVKFLVDVGDAVKEGQVMVTLDTEELRYTVERQAATLHKTMAQLGLTDEQGQVKDIAQLPTVKKAAADLFDAEQRVRRARDLYKQALLPQQDLDTLESRYRSLSAQYDVEVQQVRTFQAQFESERADLNLARKKLRDAEIRAPFDGFVQERSIAPGQYLRVQTPVMTLVKPDPLRLRADVPERMMPWVGVGLTVEARSEALPNKVFTGKISRITPSVKDQSRSFAIEALIDNHEHLLKPGLFVKANIKTSKNEPVLLIPETALTYEYGIYRVLVVDNGKLVGRDVKLGDKVNNLMEVAEGVRAGEMLALHPEKLKEGTAVRPQ